MRADRAAVARVRRLGRASSKELDDALRSLLREWDIERALDFASFWLAIFCECFGRQLALGGSPAAGNAPCMLL